MLYAVKTRTKGYEGTHWFFIVSHSIEAAEDACTDEQTEVLEVTSAVETVVSQEFDGLVMLSNI